MSKIKIPEYYKIKTRSREGMIAHLVANCGYHGYHQEGSPLAWCVKVHSVNFDFRNLWPMILEHAPNDAQEFKGGLETVWDEWIEDQGNASRIWEASLDDAQRNVTDCDCYKDLWDGTKVDAELSFTGRSGGYLILTSFLSKYSFRNWMDDDDFADELREWSYEDLCKLYKYCLMMDHDLTPEKASREVEYQGAFYAWQVVLEESYNELKAESLECVAGDGV